MVRDLWIITVALFAFGIMAELSWLNIRQRARSGSRQLGPWLPTLTFDWSHERSEYMRTER